MIQKDFWSKSAVAVIGGGNWGTALALLLSRNVGDVRVWMRDQEMARSINSTRTNPHYLSTVSLSEKIHAYTEIERVFEGKVNAVIWALPSSACREQAKKFSGFFGGDEILIHATKGVEAGSLKRISQVLVEEIPCRRVGVLSGPNLAVEVGKGEPAGTIIASHFQEVCDAGRSLFRSDRFMVFESSDVVGVEWAGTLKNVLAIASGCLEGMGLGMNSRAMLLSRGLRECVRFGMEMGAEMETFLGLAGIGDMVATCMSPLSRNYQVGVRLARGDTIDTILDELESSAEGVRTAQSVYAFAQARGIHLPIIEAVCQLLSREKTADEALRGLLSLDAKV